MCLDGRLPGIGEYGNTEFFMKLAFRWYYIGHYWILPSITCPGYYLVRVDKNAPNTGDWIQINEFERNLTDEEFAQLTAIKLMQSKIERGFSVEFA